MVFRDDVKATFDPENGVMVVEDDSKHPDAPLFVDLTITYKCNAGCPFCYMSSTPSGPCAPVENIIRFVESFPKKPFYVALGGGEPTLHPELPTIIEELRKRGIECTMSIGRGADLEMLEKVLPTVRRVGVSVGDRVEETFERLKLCGKKGVLHIPMFPKEVEVGMKVLIPAVREAKTDGVLLLAPNPVGRAEGNNVDEDFIRKTILVFYVTAFFLNVKLYGNPCWTNRNVDIPPHLSFGCMGGQWSMCYDAVTGRSSRCSFLKEEYSSEHPEEWWKKQTLISGCRFERPQLFPKKLPFIGFPVG